MASGNQPSPVVKLLTALGNRRKRSRSSAVVWHLAALAFWLYVIVKFFFVDVDLVILDHLAPNLVPYRPYLVIGILVVLWLKFGTWRFWTALAFLIVDPLLVFARYGFRLATRHWMALVVVIPLVYAAFRPLKQQVAIGFIALGAAIVAYAAHGSPPLIISMIVLFAFLIRHYRRQFSIAFAPTRFLTWLADGLDTEWTSYKVNMLMPKIRNAKSLPTDSEEFKKKWWLDGLGGLLYINAFFGFLARKIRRVQQSQLLLIYSLVPLGFTIFLTVSVFALEYFALFKLDKASFTGESEPGFFFFMHFSFATFLTANFGAFSPASGWARFLTGAELFCTVMVGTILVFIFTTVSREQNRNHLDRVIDRLETDAIDIEAFIRQEFGLSLQDARGKVSELDPQRVRNLDVFNL